MISILNIVFIDFKLLNEMNSYQNLKIIGQGAFGNAYLATHIKNKQEYVIKKIDLRNKTQAEKDNIFNQVTLLQQFKHANIVAYKQSIIEKEQLNIIMEFCEGGDINQLISERKQNKGLRKFEEKTIIDWATQIALAIFYMHDKRVLHRDLKTPNIFISNNKVKLGDFGISKVLDESADLASTNIGTPYYMSPQQYKHKPYSYKSDIWAFGCILYEMCNQKRPFEALSIHGLAVKVLKGGFAPVSQFYSKQLRQVIKKMLQKKEKDRPTILEFLQTPIIKKKAVLYIKSVYNDLQKDNSDKQILQGIIYQARKLGIVFPDKPKQKKQQGPKKNKIEFNIEQKKSQKLQKQQLRIKLQQKERQHKQKQRQKTQELKNLQKIKQSVQQSVMKVEKVVAHDNKAKVVSSHKKQQVKKEKVEEKIVFKMKEDYPFYERPQQSESESEQSVEAIPEGDEEEDEPEKPKPLVQSYDKDKYQMKQDHKKKDNDNQPFKTQHEIPSEKIDLAISHVRQTLKNVNQEIYTIQNELSVLDFSVSSSEEEDPLQLTIGKPQVAVMKKKQSINPIHAKITDKINELTLSLEVVLKRKQIDDLLKLVRKQKTEREELQKVTGKDKVGTYHQACEIQKLNNLLVKIPLYV